VPHDDAVVLHQVLNELEALGAHGVLQRFETGRLRVDEILKPWRLRGDAG
jgi:hypothetical protein